MPPELTDEVTTMVLPRAAIPEMFSPNVFKPLLVSSTHVVPPSVVR
jgi:hypothetical protein